MPPVTTLDEPWPFFRFWHHHFWPKLAGGKDLSNDAQVMSDFDFCACPGQNVLKRDSSGKIGNLKILISVHAQVKMS